MKTRMASFQRVKTPQNPSICCAKKVPTVCQITKLQRSIGQTRSVACRPDTPLQELWCKGSLRPRSRRATGTQKRTNTHACMSQSTYPYIRISHIWVPLVIVLVFVVVVVVVAVAVAAAAAAAVQNTLPGLKDLKHGDDWNPTCCKVSFGVWRYSEVIQPANMVMPWASTWGSVRSSILSGQSTRIALFELRAFLIHHHPFLIAIGGTWPWIFLNGPLGSESVMIWGLIENSMSSP